MEMSLTPDVDFADRISLADYKSRCWVQGSKRYSFVGADGKAASRIDPICGSFDARFDEHPWVRQSVIEGWDRDLRSFLIRRVKQLLLEGKAPDGIPLGELMPHKPFVDAARQQAKLSREGRQWRDQICTKYDSVDSYLQKTVARRNTISRPGRAQGGAA